MRKKTYGKKRKIKQKRGEIGKKKELNILLKLNFM